MQEKYKISISINYHLFLINYNPWPLTGVFRTIIFLIRVIKVYAWWWKVTRKGILPGVHITKVIFGLKVEIILIITSKYFFFSIKILKFDFYIITINPLIKIYKLIKSLKNYFKRK